MEALTQFRIFAMDTHLGYTNGSKYNSQLWHQKENQNVNQRWELLPNKGKINWTCGTE